MGQDTCPPHYQIHRKRLIRRGRNHHPPRICKNYKIRIKNHPPSGWFCIFGHSPILYWQRTSAFFIGLPATQLLLATRKNGLFTLASLCRGRWILRSKRRRESSKIKVTSNKNLSPTRLRREPPRQMGPSIFLLLIIHLISFYAHRLSLLRTTRLSRGFLLTKNTPLQTEWGYFSIQLIT